MNKFSNKKEFRDYCKKKLFGSYLGLNGMRRLETALEGLLKTIGAKRVLLFLPMDHEPQIERMFGKRKSFTLFVPFMEGKSFKMVKYRLPVKKGKFEIKEPSNSFFRLSRIDAAIVPVIGVDGGFRRVGFGKGMYDRFFEGLGYRPFIIFTQTKKCMTKKLLCDSYDIRGDFYVTPDEIYVRGDSYVVRTVGREFCRHYKWRCRIFDSKKGREGKIRSL